MFCGVALSECGYSPAVRLAPLIPVAFVVEMNAVKKLYNSTMVQFIVYFHQKAS